MSWRALHAIGLGAVVFYLSSPTIAKADDQQLVEDYLKARGALGAVVRPITDDYVGRTFPNLSFFGVIFRQYPVAVLCPQTGDLKCSNVFFVKDGQVDFVATIPSNCNRPVFEGTFRLGQVTNALSIPTTSLPKAPPGRGVPR